MTWNKCFQMYLDIRDAFVAAYDEDYLDSCYDALGTTCIEAWVAKLPDPKWHNMIAPLVFTEHDGYLLMKYADLDIDWDAYDGLYRHCRTCVIDIVNDELAMAGFDKFFNINERPETELALVQEKVAKASHIEITDKLDGSMVLARWCNGRLLVGGSKALDREMSFRLDNYYSWFDRNPQAVDMIRSYPEYTFIFEGIFSNDIHIVEYDEDERDNLYLIGVRDMLDGYQLDYDFVCYIADNHNVPHTTVFDMTFDEMVDAIGQDAVNKEGFVVNVDGQLYKLKYDTYRQLHNCLSKMISPNVCIASVRDGFSDDLIAKIPTAYKDRAIEIIKNVRLYAHTREHISQYWVDMVWDEYDGSDVKEFMLGVDNVVPAEYRGYVRNLYRYKKNDYFKGRKYYQMVEWLQKMADEGWVH